MEPKEIKVLSYNILDVELESNFVPRNMHKTSQELVNNVDNLIDQNVDFGLDNKGNQILNLYNYLLTKYLPYHSGNGFYESNGTTAIGKTEVRKMWAVKDDISDPHPNLMHILNEFIKPDKVETVYEEIKKINYSWISDDVQKKNRLDRVYEKIIKYEADIVCLQEYGNCKKYPESIVENVTIGGGTVPSTFASKQNVDLDAAEESSANEKTKTNSNNPEKQSLAEKLINAGYVYKLFSYNPTKKDGDDGVAIFFKEEKFELLNKIYVDMDSIIKQNTDSKLYSTQRGCGLLELEFKSDHTKKVAICTTHIQTKTNEKDTNKPYAIRSGELQFIKDHINEKYNSQRHLVIFCGDLNLNLNEDKDKRVIDEFVKDNILKRIKTEKINDTICVHEPNSQLVTSYPSGRQEYIDYFFTNNTNSELSGDYITLDNLNDETIPNSGTSESIPDQPSDHIPILLTIDLTKPQETVGGKTRKMRRNPKRKTQRKKQRKTKRKISKPKNKSKK
jgi:endonuclease/exonuclease/phosphatase family metal-dependent hydrolase